MYINVTSVSFSDVTKVYGNISLKPVNKNGNTFLEVDKLSWKFTASKLNLKFDNLFNGDKALGKLKFYTIVLIIQVLDITFSYFYKLNLYFYNLLCTQINTN